jgi:hypothetical protein
MSYQVWSLNIGDLIMLQRKNTKNIVKGVPSLNYKCIECDGCALGK